jgi:hypothetical protein
LIHLVLGEPPENLIRDLTPGSTLLKDLNESFGNISRRVEIITCFELRQTPTTINKQDGSGWERKGPKKMMITQDSACLYLLNERRIPINENHSMIAKLSTREGSKYHTVKNEISKIVDQARTTVSYRYQQRDMIGVLQSVDRRAKVAYKKMEVSTQMSNESLQELQNIVRYSGDLQCILDICYGPQTAAGCASRIFTALKDLDHLFEPYALRASH